MRKECSGICKDPVAAMGQSDRGQSSDREETGGVWRIDQSLQFLQRGSLLKTLGLGGKGSISSLHANHRLSSCYCFSFSWMHASFSVIMVARECSRPSRADISRSAGRGNWGSERRITGSPECLQQVHGQGTVCTQLSLPSHPADTCQQVVELLKEVFLVCQADSTVWCCAF